MSSIFSGKSNYPQPDNWPWLFNRRQTDDPEFTIVYAEHYMKLRDFILKAERQLVRPTAKSDGTLSSLTYQYHLRASLNQILAAFAYSAWSSSSTALIGNCLPFEFVFAETTGDYLGWGARQDSPSGVYARMLVETPGLPSVLQGDDVFASYPQVSCTLRPKGGMRSGFSTPGAWTSGRLHVLHHVLVGQATDGTNHLVVRGMILDTEYEPGAVTIADREAASNLWSNLFSDLDLHVTVLGARS